MTSFPENIDTDEDLPRIDDNVTNVSAETINAIRDAVIAIEETLGSNLQGTQENLVARLSQVLNPDGTIKAAALSSSGLVSLPIDNAQIGDSAAIKESKLDLDFSTSQLHDEIISNDVDIESIQHSLSATINRLAKHVAGIADRHTSDQIDHVLRDGYSDGYGSNLKLATDYIWGALLAHISHRQIREHWASAIEYIPQGINPAITAHNVQDAISQIDYEFVEQMRQHSDSHHSDGVSGDGYIALNGQAIVNDASAKLVRLPQSPNLLKLGLINSVTLKSDGFLASALSPTSSSITVVAGVGSGSTKSITVTNLHTASYPSAINKPTLKGVVDYLNNQFDISHFPCTAFEAELGELAIQHNINRIDATIKISAPSNPAVAALGFSSIQDITVQPLQNYALQIDGYTYQELATVYNAAGLVQASATSTIDINAIPGDIGLTANSLVHIYNHTTASANGTYRITSLGAGTTVNINASLASGVYSIVIYRDTVDSSFTGSPKTIDAYIDGQRVTSSSVRQETTSSGISGIKIVEVSSEFHAASGSMSLTKSGSIYSLSITISGATGLATEFPAGYLGYKTVYAPDNQAYVVVLIYDVSPLFPRTDTITFYNSGRQDNKLYLGSTHTDAGATLEMPIGKRNVGLVGSSVVASEFIESVLERDISNFHLSGVIRGYDLIQIDGGNNSATIDGGTAYIEGKIVNKTRQSINITNVATSAGIWNLLLSKYGNYELYQEGTAGYSVADILAGSDYALIRQFTVNSSPAITASADARLFVNDLESRIQLSVDDRELGAGSFRSLEAAILYSKYAPNDTKPDITILSDLTISSALTIDSGSRIISFGDLTISADITLSSNSSLDVYGDIDCTAQITVGSNSELILRGTNSFTVAATSISIGAGADVRIFGDTSITIIDFTANDACLTGNETLPVVTFAAGGGIVIDDGLVDINISYLQLIITNSTTSIIGGSNVSNFSADNLVLTQVTPVTTSSIGNGATGITLFGSSCENITIRNCNLHDLTGAINVFGTNIEIVNNYISNVNVAVSISNGANQIIAGNIVSNLEGVFVNSLSGANDNVLITSNIINANFDVSSNPVLVRSNASVSGLGYIFSNNSVSDISTNDSLFQNINSAQILDVVISNNVFHRLNLTAGWIGNFRIGSNNVANAKVCGNIISKHVGRLFTFGNGIMSGNTIGLSNPSAITVLNVAANSPQAQVLDNTIVGSATDVLTFGSCVVRGNIFQVGNIILTDTSGGFHFASNKCLLGSTSVTNAISCSITTTAYSVIQNNWITASPVGATIGFGLGKIMVLSNVITAGSGTAIIQAGTGTFSASNQIVIDGNVLTASSSINRAIFANTRLVKITNNVSSGQYSAAEIEAVVGAFDLFITGNWVNGTGLGGKIVRHQNSAPANTSIFNNKNASETCTYSAIDSLQKGTWTSSVILPNTVQLVSAGSNDVLVIPLTNLPIGAQLVSVSLYATTPTAANSLNIRLVKRSSTSSSTNELGPILGVGNIAFIYQQITISPSVTEYVSSNVDYLLVVTSTSAGNIVGQVIANINR